MTRTSVTASVWEARRRYAAYLDDGLENYLRGYLFWLIEKREPRMGEPLPTL